MMAVWVTLALAVVYLGASWFPFTPDLPKRSDNRIDAHGEGVFFTPPSLALVPAGPAWFAEAEESVEITLRLRSARIHQDGPARLLSLGTDLLNQELIIGQDGSDLVVRNFRTEHGQASMTTARAERVIEPGRWQEVQVRLAERVRITVDGVEHAHEPFPALFHDLDPRTRLSLGAETSGNRAWFGALREVVLTIDGTRHDLLAEEALEIPGALWQLPDRLDETGLRSVRTQLVTSVLHVLLTFAIGAGAAVVWARRGHTRLLICWALVAVVVNLVKVGVASRHPSLATTLLQIAGGWLGIVAASCAYLGVHASASE